MSQISGPATTGPGSGTVTSITFNGGLTSTPDPITTTGTATLDQSALTVADGTVYWTGSGATGKLNTTATGTSGFVLTSNGAGVAPTYQAVSASGGVTTLHTQDGNNVTPTAGVINLSGGNNLTTTGTVGPNTATISLTGITQHSIQVGGAANALTQLGVATNGQLPIGSTGADPVLATLTQGTGITITNGAGSITIASSGINAESFPTDSGTATPSAGILNVNGDTHNITTTGSGNTVNVKLTGITQHSLQVGGSTNNLTQLGVATNGQLPIGSTGADPVLATLTAGSNISITNGAGSITIAANSAAQVVNYVSVNHAASPYLALATDYYIAADVTAGVVSILLPNGPTTGRVFVVKDKVGLAATSNITVTTVGGVVNIDGATTFVMNTAYESAEFIFNGSSYEIF